MPKQLKLPSRIDIRRALSTKPPTPDHVLPGLPTGAVGALVAPGSTGKTMYLLQLCMGLATGLPAFGEEVECLPNRVGQPTPACVVLAVAEETADEMHRRIHAAAFQILHSKPPVLAEAERDRFLDLLDANLHVYPLAGAARILIDGRDAAGDGLEVLRQMSLGARLVVIDPLRQFHTGDENDSYAMTAVVQACQDVAVSSGCAVLVAHHTNKQSTWQGSGDQAAASRGSAAFTDGVRWQLNLSKLDDRLADEYRLSDVERITHVRADLAKANYIAPQPPRVFRRTAGGVLTLVGRPAGKRKGVK